MSEFLKENAVGIAAGASILGASVLIGYFIGKRTKSHGRIFFKAHEEEHGIITDYLFKFCLNEPLILQKLREETKLKCKESLMLVDPIEAQFVRLLLKTIGAKRCIEVGVFTGYNACSMALALPDDGEVIACDIEEGNINIGKPMWDQAAARKIKVKIGPAIDTLAELIDKGCSGSFDLVFIDANKDGYDSYYEKGLVLLREGGFIAVDNTIWGGRVAMDASLHDKSTQAIHALNLKMHKDERVEFINLMIGDGLALCRKK